MRTIVILSQERTSSHTCARDRKSNIMFAKPEATRGSLKET